MLPTFQPGRRFHRRNPPSPHSPAPAPVSVVDVFSDMTNDSTWVFTDPVPDPAGSVAGFVVFGYPGLSWSRDGEGNLVIHHAGPVVPGHPWSNTAGAGNIPGLTAGSGTVIE
jgi:hypothetical protein